MENQIIKEGESKSGTSFVIRYPNAQDAKGVLEYINKLSKERTYIRFQGEAISLEDEEKYIRTKLDEISENKSVVLFLFVNKKVHGICNIDLSDKTESHVAGLGLSVDQTMRGQGLGELLMQTALEEAKKQLSGLQIVKLAVKHPNNTAIRLYEKLGFKKYGHLPKGTRHQNELVDEILMYKEVQL